MNCAFTAMEAVKGCTMAAGAMCARDPEKFGSVMKMNVMNKKGGIQSPLPFAHQTKSVVIPARTTTVIIIIAPFREDYPHTDHESLINLIPEVGFETIEHIPLATA